MAIGSDGLEVGVNSSYSYWGWEQKYKIDFGGNITGDLAYTMLYQGLQLILPLKESGPVRVILPTGYTTGDRILGLPGPLPDQIITDKNGTVISWTNPGQIIEVGHYKKREPETLKKGSSHYWLPWSPSCCWSIMSASSACGPSAESGKESLRDGMVRECLN